MSINSASITSAELLLKNLRSDLQDQYEISDRAMCEKICRQILKWEDLRTRTANQLTDIIDHAVDVACARHEGNLSQEHADHIIEKVMDHLSPMVDPHYDDGDLVFPEAETVTHVVPDDTVVEPNGFATQSRTDEFTPGQLLPLHHENCSGHSCADCNCGLIDYDDYDEMLGYAVHVDKVHDPEWPGHDADCNCVTGKEPLHCSCGARLSVTDRNTCSMCDGEITTGNVCEWGCATDVGECSGCGHLKGLRYVEDAGASYCRQCYSMAKDEAETLRRREAVDAAMEAFWHVISDRYFDVPSGDLPFDVSNEFDSACWHTVGKWIDINKEDK